MKAISIPVILAALLLPAAGYAQGTEIISGLASSQRPTFTINLSPLPGTLGGLPVGAHLAGVFIRIHILDPSEIDSVWVSNANKSRFPVSAIIGSVGPGPVFFSSPGPSAKGAQTERSATTTESTPTSP